MRCGAPALGLLNLIGLLALAGGLHDAAAGGLSARQRTLGRAGLGWRQYRRRGLHPAGRQHRAAPMSIAAPGCSRARACARAARRHRRICAPSRFICPGGRRWTPASFVAPRRMAASSAATRRWFSRARGGSAAGRRWRWSPRLAVASVRRRRAAVSARDGAVDRVFAGELHAEPAAPASPARAARTPAGAFSASDVGNFDELIDRGTRANLADDFVQSEALFRRAVEVQEKALVHAQRPFYNDLVTFMVEGPVLVSVLEGEGAVAKNRAIMGATNPKDAAPGTIRKDLAESLDRNVVHGSDSLENAKIEIAFFFKPTEIHSRALSGV